MDSMGDTIILGTKGGLKIPSAECYNGSFDRPLKVFHNIAGNPVETEIPLSTEPDTAFYDKIRSVLDAIKENGTTPIPSSEIILNQAIINGIIDSAKLGKEIEITIPEI